MTLLAAALPAFAQSDPFESLGIPVAAPYEDPAAKAAREKAAAKAAAPPHPLEAALDGRLAADLAEVLALRDALTEAAAYARSRPQAFPPAPVERAELFEEWAEEARRAWARAADLLAALDAHAARYAAAHELKAPKSRAAAFLVLASAWAARARFARDVARYGDNDPLVKAVLDAAVSGVGLPAGAFSAFVARHGGPEGAASAGLVKAARQATGRAGLPTGPLFTRAARALDADLKALPAALPRRFSLAAACAAAGPLWTAAPSYEAPAGEAPERPLLPVFLPPPADAVSVSSQVAYAVESARRLFRLDASSAPTALSRRELAEFAARLEPGDVLLARRWGAGAPGQAGWWDAAALYAGTDAGRRAAFGDDSLSAELRALAPSFVQASTQTPLVDLPTVVAAGPAGTAATSLSRFGAAEAVAALRPRAGREARAAALRRAAALVGAPYDPSQRPGGAAVAEGELVQRAYAGALDLPDEPAAGARAASPGGLALAFDAAFGTPRQELDFVAGLGPGAEAEDRRIGLEAFRALSRGPKRFLRTTKENAP